MFVTWISTHKKSTPMTYVTAGCLPDTLSENAFNTSG